MRIGYARVAQERPVEFDRAVDAPCSIIEGIDTTEPGVRFVVPVVAALAEFEREIDVSTLYSRFPRGDLDRFLPDRSLGRARK